MTATLADRVEVVVVTHESGAVIEACLEALGGQFAITVVDNDSRDDTRGRIARHGARLVPSAVNLGYGRAANLALERSDREFALLLNPDCLASPEAVARLVAAADRYPEAAILAPQHRDADGSLWLHHWPDLWRRGAIRRHPQAGIAPEGDLCAETVAGTAVLLRLAALRDIGFFDPRIFLFYEDDDLCLRVRAKGFACVLVGDAWVTHAGGASSRGDRIDWVRPWHAAWSRLYLEAKYRGRNAGHRQARAMLLGNLVKLAWPAELFDGRRRVPRAARISAAWRFIKGGDPPGGR